MSNAAVDVLVILALTPGVDVEHVITQYGGVVSQAISNRIAVVSLPETSLERLDQSDSVKQVIKGQTSSVDLSEMTDEEKLFVSAWLSRKAETEKQRRGDGQDWDASGFSAP